MRDALRWGVRQPRVWFAAGAVLVATLMAAAGELGGAGRVVFWAYPLAALSVVVQYRTDHPGVAERRAERARARQQERVDEILRRYEARRRGEPERLSRAERRRRAEVDAILWRYERQRLARERARGGR